MGRASATPAGRFALVDKALQGFAVAAGSQRLQAQLLGGNGH